MITTGVLLKANEARLVSLSGTRGQCQLVASQVNKIVIAKNPTQQDIAEFISALQAYLSSVGSNALIVNRRATTGQGAGGAGTFILEGVILACVAQPVEFIHPATIRATDKRWAEQKTCRPKTQDMAKAFDLAFEGLDT